MKSLHRILALGTTLTTLALCATYSNAAQITAAQETTAISNLKPVYSYATSDTYRLTSISDTLSDMDGMSLAAATAVTGTSSYWYGDSSNNLFAMATAGSTWRTLTATSVPASWSASGTVVLSGTIENGATQGSPTVVLTITLTKTGSPADLTQAQLFNLLTSSTVTGITATTALTAISLGTAIGTTTAKWDVKGYISTGTAQTLDPLSLSVQWAGTTTAGTSLAFTTALLNLHTWNPSTGIPTAQSLTFTKDGRSLTIGNLNPSNFAKTAGIAAGVMNTLTAGLGGGSIKKLNVANVGFYNDIPSSISTIRGKLTATPGSNSINEQNNLNAAAAIAKAGFAVGDFTTTADTNKYGLLALTTSNVTSASWDIINGTTLRVLGTVGSGVPKYFSCSLSGIEVVKDDTNSVLRFNSPDNDAIFVKAFDSTGLDTSANATVPTGNRDDLLALQLLSKLSSTATIAKLTMGEIIAAL